MPIVKEEMEPGAVQAFIKKAFMQIVGGLTNDDYISDDTAPAAAVVAFFEILFERDSNEPTATFFGPNIVAQLYRAGVHATVCVHATMCAVSCKNPHPTHVAAVANMLTRLTMLTALTLLAILC